MANTHRDDHDALAAPICRLSLARRRSITCGVVSDLLCQYSSTQRYGNNPLVQLMSSFRDAYAAWREAAFPVGHTDDALGELHAQLAYWDCMVAEYAVPLRDGRNVIRGPADVGEGLRQFRSAVEATVVDTDSKRQALIEYSTYCGLLDRMYCEIEPLLDDRDTFRPGDLYEDCSFHPVLCVGVNEEDDEMWGISLIDGSQPRACSLQHCGPVALTVEEAVAIKADFAAYVARRTAEIDPSRES